MEVLIESFTSPVALREVSSLRVWDLHLYPQPFTLRFHTPDGVGEIWTTDKERHAELRVALSPKQYAPLSGKEETVGERAARCQLTLFAIETIERTP